MSEYTMYVVFEVQTIRRLRGSEFLAEFIKSSLGQGFGLCTDQSSSASFDINSAVDISLQTRLKAINEGRVSHSLNFQKKQLDVSIGFDLQTLHLFVVTVSSRSFSHDKNLCFQSVRDLVQFCEIAYHSFLPDYGYGITTPEFQPIDPSNLQVVPSIVFDFNFFGPGLVTQIGEDLLLSCPTWRSKRLDDGGILLELSADPIEHLEDFKDNYIQTAEILGLKRTRFDIEH